MLLFLEGKIVFREEGKEEEEEKEEERMCMQCTTNPKFVSPTAFTS